jgi:hypothetical protein
VAAGELGRRVGENSLAIGDGAKVCGLEFSRCVTREKRLSCTERRTVDLVRAPRGPKSTGRLTQPGRLSSMWPTCQRGSKFNHLSGLPI